MKLKSEKAAATERRKHKKNKKHVKESKKRDESKKREEREEGRKREEMEVIRRRQIEEEVRNIFKRSLEVGFMSFLSIIIVILNFKKRVWSILNDKTCIPG